MELVDKTVRYSKNERRAFQALPRDGKPVSTTALTEKIYGKGKRPYYARQVVLGTMIALAGKLKANKEPMQLQKSKRQGPHPVEFWLEKK